MPVSSSSASTSVPGTNAPCASETSPWMLPLIACTWERREVKPIPQNRITRREILLATFVMAAPGTNTFIRETSAGKSNVCARLQGSWLQVESSRKALPGSKKTERRDQKSLLISVFRLVDFVKTVSRQAQRLKRLMLLSSRHWELAVSLLRQTRSKSSPRRPISPIRLSRSANLGLEGMAGVVALFAQSGEIFR